jgi:DNA-binding NarL/FixJ family response regulator
MGRTTVFIIEDHELVRKGINSIISADESLEIIGQYDKPTIALEDIASGKLPDLIIMDISMPEMNGLEAAKIIAEKYPSIKVIILSMHKDEAYVIEGLTFNIHGYVVKDSVADEILVAIDRVKNGGKFFSNDVINTALGSYKTKRKEKKQQERIQLTKRELEVLNDIANGLKSQEIADKLYISERTVEAHRGNIMKKLQAKNMAELIKKAMSLGLID